MKENLKAPIYKILKKKHNEKDRNHTIAHRITGNLFAIHPPRTTRFWR